KAQYAEAVRTAEKLRGMTPSDPEVLCDLARCYARCVPDLSGELITAEDHARRKEYTALAIQALREAVRNGFNRLDPMKSFPDFASIRATDEFQNLLRQLEATKRRRASEGSWPLD